MRKNKSKEILDYFIKHSTVSFSIKEIAAKFGISDRQVKNYIKQINEQASPVPMIVPVSSGIYKICDDYQKHMDCFQKSELLPKERVSMILSKLLISREPLNIFDLADELYVSRPTIESDIKRIKKILTSFDIHLQISNDILTIEGSEKSFRRVTSYMITNTEYDGFLVGDNHLFLNSDYQVDFIMSNLISIFNECHFVFNDYSLNNIVLHLIIAIDRIRNEYYIEDTRIDNLVSDVETKAANMIADFLEENFGIQYSKIERENLAVFLSCNLATVDYKVVNPQRIEGFLLDGSSNLAGYILEKIADYYYLDSFDDIFFTRFVLHINNLLKRLHSNFSAHNPMCHDIQQTYPLIYDIAVFAAEIIQEQTGYSINEDEISLIALHIGSLIESNQVNKNKLSAIYVYANYHSFYQKNVSTLQQKYGDQLNLQYCISIMDYKNSSLTADIIISEVPLNKAILISPFITSNQLIQIGQQIVSNAHEKELDTFHMSLCGLFTEDIFFQDVCGVDKYEILKKLGAELKEKGYVDDAFLESVYKREQLSSTCFTDGIAIPHAISHNVKKSFISFTRYSHSQPWGDKSVSLVIFIGISYPERKTFRSVFNHLVKLFEKQSSVHAIAKCTTYEEIIKTINMLNE